MSHSKYVQNMMDAAADVLAGKRAGNKRAAEIALSIAIYRPTLDLILETTTSDEQLNADIVRAVTSDTEFTSQMDAQAAELAAKYASK